MSKMVDIDVLFAFLLVILCTIFSDNVVENSKETLKNTTNNEGCHTMPKSSLQRKASLDLSQAVRGSNRSPEKRRMSLASPIVKEVKDVKSKFDHLKMQAPGTLAPRAISVCRSYVNTNKCV